MLRFFVDTVEKDTAAEQIRQFLLQRKRAHRLYIACQLLMAVQMEYPLIRFFLYQCSYHTDHPDNTQDMVAVFVCYDNMMQCSQWYSCLFKLYENAITPAGICQKIFFVISTETGKRKTGIITTRCLRVAGSKNDHFFHMINPVKSI